MNRKKCNAQVSPTVAAETTRAIRSTCDSFGFDADQVEAVVSQLRPLCHSCTQKWGVDEDDLTSPGHSSSD